ncbi:MAG: BMP family protein [Aquincola tertiaricarbonis]|uniref:BMP family protein n=1 Tax=Aquincola sp. J276 TaxID=2898432 RepID=UPI0021511E2C|nr:BMP family protein [Aquincola sp. J276]MCR5867886.1 BMP family protein [Aquincola sp. J276]
MSLSRRQALAAAAAAGLFLALAHRPSAAQAKVKVAAVYTVPVGQLWVGRIDKALKAAAARGEIDYVFSENVAAADYERVLSGYAEQGHALIVGDAFAVEELARKVARKHPKTAFLMGSSARPQKPNFAVFDNYIVEPAFLTGMIAAGMSKSGRIGLVAGHPIAEANRLMNAFMAGARDVDPKVRFHVTFIDSWFDPPKAKQAAFQMIDQGVDVLYAERFGVADAAKERKVLAIGNVINTQDKYPETVVASALWNMEPAIDAALAAVKAGKFKAEDYARYSMMKVGGGELAPLGTFEDKVPEALKAKVAAREKAMREGKFRVRINNAEPRGSR